MTTLKSKDYEKIIISSHLDPDVTYNQVQEFTLNKLIPEFERIFVSKVYSLKGIRGENKYRYGMIYIYNSVEDKNKDWNDDGGLTDLGTEAMQKMQPTLEEFQNKFGIFEYTYTDLIVQ